MAGKVDKKQQAPPLLLAQAQKMVKKALPSPAVQLVSEWALFNAFLFAASGAFAYFVDIPCSESSWFSPCIELTDAAAAKAVAILYGLLWCTAAMAAAAALALMLPGRRSRRALAYVALAAAAADHYVYGSGTCLFLDADPGYLYLRIVGTVATFFFAAGDLLGFLALLLGEDDE